MPMRTLFLQETIKRGLLMTYVVPSLAHDVRIIERAIESIREALVVMKNAGEGGIKGIIGAIDGPTVKPVFRKFN
jgi:glutamate-1-semialdehyde 2,1-aminomutase